MRIRDVRVYHPATPGAPDDWRRALGQIAVVIETDSGLMGYGVGGGGDAAAHVIRAVYRRLLLDQNVEPVEEHWSRIYRASLPYGRKGLAIMALSGVDLALWDLRGKAAGKPIHELLGGMRHRRIPMYASLGHEPADAVAAGYSALKLHLPPIQSPRDRTTCLETVRAARRAIGSSVRLMVDAFMGWDVESALALDEPLRSLGVEWLEEPLAPDDFAGYELLARQATTAIAGGEHEYTARAFDEIAKRRLHRILQPDVCWCGGMSELVKIYEIAKQHGLSVCPHRGAEVWALHAIAALCETDPLAEAGRSWIDWLEGQPQPERGCVAVPDQPGFGVAFDESQFRSSSIRSPRTSRT